MEKTLGVHGFHDLVWGRVEALPKGGCYKPINYSLPIEGTREFDASALRLAFLCVRLCRWAGGLRRGLAKIVIVCHPPADNGVQLPLHRSRGERALRFCNFLERGEL